MVVPLLPATLAEAKPDTPLGHFLSVFVVGPDKLQALTKEFEATFQKLAAESSNQFLPTPIPSALLAPISELGKREVHATRHLAIDIGGTNLRVGFVELSPQDDTKPPSIDVLLEQSCPIGEQLKSKNPNALFDWIGETIAAVVKNACSEWDLDLIQPLPMGVTFSFPMEQKSLSEASLMSMGKGFELDDGTNLASQLLRGYEKYRGGLPPVTISAIANDSVSTLISFIYQYSTSAERRAAMGLIVGTGCNATVPLPAATLGRKLEDVHLNSGTNTDSPGTKITVNTEWSINGTAPPLRKFGLVTKWDEELDQQGEVPGFQPLEYLTAGRYIGELGRIVFLDYLTTQLRIVPSVLPCALRERYSMSTTFLSYFGPPSPRFLEKLENTFPPEAEESGFVWNESHVEILYEIAQAIERRAASILAAATIALLRVSGDIPALMEAQNGSADERTVLGVGYTGGCIVNFQNYLYDYEKLIEQIIAGEFGKAAPVRVELMACHHGGITGAGILAAAVAATHKNGAGH